MNHSRNREDALLAKTKALPAAAGSTNTDSIDLASGDAFHADCEALIDIPVLTATELPDDKTATYVIEHSDDNSSFSTLYEIAEQVGDTGAAAVEKRFRFPSDVKRYIRLKCTTGTGAGDCSGKSMVIKLLF